MSELAPRRYSGNAYVGIWADDNFLGLYPDPVNFKALDITPDGDDIIVPNTGTEYFGMPKHIDFAPKPTKVTAEVDEHNWDLLAAQVRGTIAAYSQSSGASQTVTKTLVKGKGIYIGARNVGSVAITSLTAGTDYKVLPGLGVLIPLSDDSEGEHEITYSKGAITGKKVVVGGSKPMFIGIYGELKEHHSGDIGLFWLSKLHISPKSPLALINAKNQEGKFDAMVTIPATGTGPFGTDEPWGFLPQLTMTPPA